MSRRGRYRKPGFLSDPAASLRALKDRFRLRPKYAHEPALRVRPARPSDLSFIVELSGRVFSKYGPYREWIDKWFRSEAAITIVALMGEKPVGFAMLGRFSDAAAGGILVAELLAIAVAPGKQRKGAGRMLMQEIEEIALSLVVNKLVLHTAKENLPAQALFKSCLFRPSQVKQKFYPAGQDALQMEKDIL
jgi:ribosomal protein S18 acetylase RimI-like enzyme